ncbi:MAG: esterase-like activity of phytase family protein [Myxococcota bacterium]
MTDIILDFVQPVLIGLILMGAFALVIWSLFRVLFSVRIVEMVFRWLGDSISRESGFIARETALSGFVLLMSAYPVGAGLQRVMEKVDHERLAPGLGSLPGVSKLRDAHVDPFCLVYSDDINMLTLRPWQGLAPAREHPWRGCIVHRGHVLYRQSKDDDAVYFLGATRDSITRLKYIAKNEVFRVDAYRDELLSIGNEAEFLRALVPSLLILSFATLIALIVTTMSWLRSRFMLLPQRERPVARSKAASCVLRMQALCFFLATTALLVWAAQLGLLHAKDEYYKRVFGYYRSLVRAGHEPLSLETLPGLDFATPANDPSRRALRGELDDTVGWWSCDSEADGDPVVQLLPPSRMFSVPVPELSGLAVDSRGLWSVPDDGLRVVRIDALSGKHHTLEAATIDSRDAEAIRQAFGAPAGYSVSLSSLDLEGVTVREGGDLILLIERLKHCSSGAGMPCRGAAALTVRPHQLTPGAGAVLNRFAITGVVSLPTPGGHLAAPTSVSRTAVAANAGFEGIALLQEPAPRLVLAEERDPPGLVFLDWPVSQDLSGVILRRRNEAAFRWDRRLRRHVISSRAANVEACRSECADCLIRGCESSWQFVPERMQLQMSGLSAVSGVNMCPNGSVLAVVNRPHSMIHFICLAGLDTDEPVLTQLGRVCIRAPSSSPFGEVEGIAIGQTEDEAWLWIVLDTNRIGPSLVVGSPLSDIVPLFGASGAYD